MKLFFVGGFLGSGKTTAIKHAADYLQGVKNMRIGVITNDQGKLQVDAQFIQGHDIPVKEVNNGCFCCNFPELEHSIRFLNNSGQPDIIFAESVGSCTDLIATVINPLWRLHANIEMVLSVFCDSRLLRIYLEGNEKVFSDNVNYIFRKQLDEADIVIVNKVDLLNDEQLKWVSQSIESEFPEKLILYQNSLNSDDIHYWVSKMVNDDTNPLLRKPLDLDYAIYGAGEAELGWVDAELGIVTTDNSAVAGGVILINKIYDKINQQGHPIGHLKFLINDGKQIRKISFTAIRQFEDLLESLDFETNRIILLINARVQADAIRLKEIISESVLELEALTGSKVTEGQLEAFQPGFPRPTYRIPVL